MTRASAPDMLYRSRSHRSVCQIDGIYARDMWMIIVVGSVGIMGCMGEGGVVSGGRDMVS
jgi:hypothetical protein